MTQSLLADLAEGAVHGWKPVLTRAADDKKKRFGDAAKDAMRFYSEPHDFMYAPDYAQRSSSFLAGEADYAPSFRVTVNKVAELVELFLPVLYHRNPVRTVTPRVPKIDPQVMAELLPPQERQQAAMQAEESGQPFEEMLVPFNPEHSRSVVRSKLIESYLNTTPNELNLKRESRDALVEGLVKGRGCLWTEVKQGPNGRTVGSFYDSVDNLLIDPDAQRLQDAKWIARRKVRSIHAVRKEFGLTEDELKAKTNHEDEQNLMDKKSGKSTELVEYFEVYSKMGFGGRMLGATDDMKEKAEAFGDYVFLVIQPDTRFPLNMPPKVTNSEPTDEILDDILARLEWKTPFYHDPTHGWPVVPLDFHHVPGSPWPMAHITPAMGYQKFLDWAYSFLASRMKHTSRQFVVVDETQDESLCDSVLNGRDLTLLKIKKEHTEAWNNIIGFMTQPEMNTDMWQVISAVAQAFEQATGLTELMNGTTRTQMRSAQEAQVKREMLSVRPDDMANTVEDWMSMAARNEAIAARLHLEAADVAPTFGEQFDPGDEQEGVPPEVGYYTQLWAGLVFTEDAKIAVSELDYRIESGSARKPNKDREIANISDSAQYVLPMLTQAYQMSGDPTALNEWIKLWGDASDMDVSRLLIAPPPPPPDPMKDPQLQAQLAMQQSELQMKSQTHQQDMQIKGEQHQAKMRSYAEQEQLKLEVAQIKADMEQERDQNKAAAEATKDIMEIAKEFQLSEFETAKLLMEMEKKQEEIKEARSNRDEK